MTIIGKLKYLLGKYKFVLLILALGMLFMAAPQKQQEEPQPVAAVPQPTTTAQELEEILSKIDGVGKTKVMLTEAAGSETVYQTNEDRAVTSGNESIRLETVIITNSDREEQGLVRTITPPVYLGAIIVCQGADNASVRLAVTQAVSAVTGMGTDRITVLKMK